MSPSRPTAARTALPAALLAALLALAPRAAWACSVCSAGRDDETRVAFLVTTGLLTVLPLAMVGGLAWWLWRRARELAAEEARGAQADEAISRTAATR